MDTPNAPINESHEAVPQNAKADADNCNCKSYQKKVNISIIINVVLFVALIILYFMHFSNKDSLHSASSPQSAMPLAEYNIAFVNSDTLMKQYRLFDSFKDKIENRKNELENQMSRRVRDFEREVEDFQKKIQSYAISSSEAQRIEADLMQKQEQLLMLRESMSEELINMEYEHQAALFDSIINAIEVYNEKHNFDYVLGYARGSGILLANEKYDITKEVLEILNR